jgi:adenylate cyclase
MVRQVSGGAALEPQCATSTVPPLRRFADAAASLGHVHSIPDRDGVTRYEYLAVRYGDDRDYYPSLGLEIARIYLDLPRDRMSLILGEGVRLDAVLIPTDQKARMLIHHVGKERSFRYVSAADVVHGRVDTGRLRWSGGLRRHVGARDLRSKNHPLFRQRSRRGKNATVADNIITRQFLEQSVYDKPVDLALILLFEFGLGVSLPKMRALPGATLAASTLVGYAAVSQYLFVAHGHLLPVVYPLVTILAVFNRRHGAAIHDRGKAGQGSPRDVF